MHPITNNPKAGNMMTVVQDTRMPSRSVVGIPSIPANYNLNFCIQVTTRIRSRLFVVCGAVSSALRNCWNWVYGG